MIWVDLVTFPTLNVDLITLSHNLVIKDNISRLWLEFITP